jgi:hypothetical protein
MQVTTKFNLTDRAWAFGFDAHNRDLVEVTIDLITVDFNIVKDGEIEKIVTYKISTPAYGDDIFVGENDLYKDFGDFIDSMTTKFENRKFNYPKIVADLPNDKKEVA